MAHSNNYLKNRLFRTIPNSEYFLVGLLLGGLVGGIMVLQMKEISINWFWSSSQKNTNFVVDLGVHKEADHDVAINGSLAQQLYEEVKLLCWIMTGPKNHQSKARHVKATWGKRCNYLVFMSTEEDPSLPSVALPVIENRDNLWGKTKEAFKYVYKHYYHKADWFYKADDDTYTIVENMRYMLHYHNKSDPVYLGFRFKPIVKKGYMSGGAGYVLSKEALRRFVTESLPNPKKCKKDNTGAEDAELGKCLLSVGVEPGDSRDKQGRSTFLPLYINSFLIPGSLGKDFWFWSYVYYPFNEGLECCSDNLISIHYVEPQNMYLLEYLVYHVKPFGLSYNPDFNAVVFGVQDEKALSVTSTTKSKAENRRKNGELSWDDYD